MEKENKMGIMPIKKLLFTMSVPMMLSMLVQALYNIVDSVYVSRISDYALTAVSLSFPVQNLMIAVASGTAVGVNALLSKSLGEKNYEVANQTANVSIFLALMSSLVFVVFGIFFSKFYFVVQTDIPEIIEAGYQYISICTIFSFSIFGQIMVERLLQSTGKTVFNMLSQSIGAIINIILDPILIFGYFGFPAMGAAGAATATVIAQFIGMLLGIIFNVTVNKEIKLSIREIRFRGEIAKKIYIVGFPSMLMMSISSVTVFAYNKILYGFTYLATTVFGVYFKLQSFVFMPVFGLTNGIIPIVAYNYGARNRARIIETFKTGVVTAVCIMAVGMVVFNIFSKDLLLLFDATEEMLKIGIPAFRTISICFVFAGYAISCGTVFQALGNGIYSLIISLARQIVVILPAAYLLSLTGNLNLVWYAYPISEIASVILSTIFIRRIFKERLNF